MAKQLMSLATYCGTELRRLCQNWPRPDRPSVCKENTTIWRNTCMIHVLISGILLEKYMSSSKCVSSKFPLARSALSNKRPKWITKTKWDIPFFIRTPPLWKAFFRQVPFALKSDSDRSLSPLKLDSDKPLLLWSLIPTGPFLYRTKTPDSDP